jgi:hypothetical protein
MLPPSVYSISFFVVVQCLKYMRYLEETLDVIAHDGAKKDCSELVICLLFLDHRSI